MTSKTRVKLYEEEFFKTGALAQYNIRGELLYTGCIDPPKNVNEQREGNKSKPPFPDFVDKSFFCLGQTTPPRYQCLHLITWPWFERISIFLILLNCVTLALHQPCMPRTDTESSQNCHTVFYLWLQIADYLVLGFFTIEMCIKMIAMGIFGKKTYLADAWNRLDCFIVLAGYDFFYKAFYTSFSQ